MKVLIIDDNADDRKLLRYTLARHGIDSVIEARDGQEGLDLAREQRPDLIISDALMPRLDGFQLLWKIKRDEGLRTIPFVFHSAVYTGGKDEELAFALGAEAFISKPTTPDAFWTELSTILENLPNSRSRPKVPDLLDEEREYLRQYNEVVACKLEEKVRELEESLEKYRAAEEELLKLSSAIKQSPVSIVITDVQGNIEYVNPKFTQITGYQPAEVRGKNPRVLKSGATSQEEYRRLWATISAGDVWHGEFHNLKKNSDLFWEYATIAPVRAEEGAITHYIAIKEDITEKKKLEEQLRQSQKMEAVGQLAGGIAHDFNNILMAIIGYGGILQMKMREDDPLRPNVDMLLSAAERATTLTQSLLAFSRKQMIHLQTVNLNEIIQKFGKLLARIIGEDIEIQTVCREDPLPVSVDRGQIEQVLMNLATNARDAMRHGGRLAIVTETTEINGESSAIHGSAPPGKYAVCSVTDSGLGMDEGTIEKIFEPFFTTKEIGRGTGLGLAVVYGIVNQHGGHIEVRSAPGAGTTFNIYLPLHRGGSLPEKAKTQLPTPQTGIETILLAEDESEIRKLIRGVLSDFGYTVIEAVDGEDALVKFKENRERIKLLLLDLVMPKRSGKEVYDEIKRSGIVPRTIFISGYPRDVVQRDGKVDGECELLMKPVAPQDLLRKVREVLDS